MAIVDVRPVWALSGGEMLAQLDVLHAEIARLQTQRLELIARVDQVGYAKEIGAADAVQLVAFRHRLDPPAVRLDLPRPCCSIPPAESGSSPISPAPLDRPERPRIHKWGPEPREAVAGALAYAWAYAH